MIVDSGGGSADGETDDSSSDDDSSAEDIYDVGKDTSLETNAAGAVYISYYNDTTRDLKFARSVGSGGNCGWGPSAGLWQCETVDSAGSVGKFTSLALDQEGKAHISYYDEGNKRLKHAWQVASGGNCGGGKWKCEVVDSSYKVGKYSSIDIGADGYPKIAYEDEKNHDLRYACKGPGGWDISVIDTAGDVGEDVSLAIGNDGRPRIAYHNDDEDSLYFAMKYAVCGIPQGTWITQLVDGSYRVGEDNSLALDSRDNPCISYHDEENGNLKVACWESQPPDLGLTCPYGEGIRWQTYADYQARELSVDYLITNQAAAAVYDLTITDVPVSNGAVTVLNSLPASVAPELGPGAGANYTVRFHVPMGITSFSTNTYATVRDEAGGVYFYPCRPPGP
ncbi:MAG: hypothetical protein C4534_00065 [Gaiellales bacterium]|nr:MAG: hypothetical protein C4534_00065 [Gaiellales bacterium]